jgi:hypothetical protein
MRPTSANLTPLRPYQEGMSWTELCAAARDLISGAASKIYLSGHSAHLDALGDAVRDADGRSVRVNVICFGEPPFALQHGAVLRHSSTDHLLYPHHQARHLALASDDGGALWALARDGENWEGIWSHSDPLLTALAKGFIRHDLFLQRIYGDFTDEIVDRYGPGLPGLFDWRQADDGDTASHHEKPDRSQRPA